MATSLTRRDAQELARRIGPGYDGKAGRLRYPKTASEARLSQDNSIPAIQSTRSQLKGRTVAIAWTCSTSAMLACAWWFGLREPSPLHPAAPDPEVLRKVREQSWGAMLRTMGGRPAPEGTRQTPLELGAEVPSLMCQGWINGPPPTADELAGHPVVLDVWDEM